MITQAFLGDVWSPSRVIYTNKDAMRSLLTVFFLFHSLDYLAYDESYDDSNYFIILNLKNRRKKVWSHLKAEKIDLFWNSLVRRARFLFHRVFLSSFPGGLSVLSDDTTHSFPPIDFLLHIKETRISWADSISPIFIIWQHRQLHFPCYCWVKFGQRLNADLGISRI